MILQDKILNDFKSASNGDKKVLKIIIKEIQKHKNKILSDVKVKEVLKKLIKEKERGIVG